MSNLVDVTVHSPCCVRCAQLYQHYPDLRCDPYMRQEGPGKGLTRRETFGCRNCRTFKLKCILIPQTHYPELVDLQNQAKSYHDKLKRGFLDVEAFYRLRDAQITMSHSLSLDSDQHRLEEDEAVRNRSEEPAGNLEGLSGATTAK